MSFVIPIRPRLAPKEVGVTVPIIPRTLTTRLPQPRLTPSIITKPTGVIIPRPITIWRPTLPPLPDPPGTTGKPARSASGRQPRRQRVPPPPPAPLPTTSPITRPVSPPPAPPPGLALPPRPRVPRIRPFLPVIRASLRAGAITRRTPRLGIIIRSTRLAIIILTRKPGSRIWRRPRRTTEEGSLPRW